VDPKPAFDVPGGISSRQIPSEPSRTYCSTVSAPKDATTSRTVPTQLETGARDKASELRGSTEDPTVRVVDLLTCALECAAEGVSTNTLDRSPGSFADKALGAIGIENRIADVPEVLPYGSTKGIVSPSPAGSSDSSPK